MRERNVLRKCANWVLRRVYRARERRGDFSAMPRDIGRWVIYLPAMQVGRLRTIGRVRGTYFVVFNCNYEWHRFMEYTAENCSAADLAFVDFAYGAGAR